jgi:hypothetical protein
MINLLLLTHVAATLVMAGIIWFVQIVHYPLFGFVGVDEFAAYEFAHTQRTGWVVGPPMLLELGTAALLLWLRPAIVEPLLLWTGAVLLAVIWLSTALLQVPRHNLLSRGFDETAYRALVATNWIRTIGWSLRAVLVLWLLAQVMR